MDGKRLDRQVLGPKVPVSWFRNLDDTSIDLLPVDDSEPCISSDPVQNPIQIAVDPRRFCQIAVAAVTMGDLNAVYAFEAAHRRQLLSVGSLQTRSMLVPDLFILALFHFSRLHLKDDFTPAQRADAMYESLGMGWGLQRNVGHRSNTRCGEAS